MAQAIDRGWVNIWDPLVRCGHWTLVAAFAAAYLSAQEESGGPDQLHVLRCSGDRCRSLWTGVHPSDRLLPAVKVPVMYVASAARRHWLKHLGMNGGSSNSAPMTVPMPSDTARCVPC
jgi:hypothetical protein